MDALRMLGGGWTGFRGFLGVPRGRISRCEWCLFFSFFVRGRVAVSYSPGSKVVDCTEKREYISELYTEHIRTVTTARRDVLSR